MDSKRTFKFALALLLAFSLVVHADWASFMRTQLANAWAGGSWQATAGAALMLSFMLVILAYMASVIFGSKELRMWAKAELLQVIASTAMVAGLIILTGTLIAGASTIAANIAGPTPLTITQQQNPFSLAHYYLDIQINCAKTYYRRIFWTNLAIEPMALIVMPTGGMEEITGWALSGIVGSFYWITHNLTFLLIADYFQRHLLILIEDNAFTVLLPIGIVLRILPYTRGAGGVIIAIAMGLFLVYPLMYAIFLGLIPNTACGAAPPDVIYYEANDPTTMALMTTFVNDRTMMSDLFNFINAAKTDLEVLFFFSIVAPIVNLTVTLTFIRAVMQFMGADVAEMGEGLLKII